MHVGAFALPAYAQRWSMPAVAEADAKGKKAKAYAEMPKPSQGQPRGRPKAAAKANASCRVRDSAVFRADLVVPAACRFGMQTALRPTPTQPLLRQRGQVLGPALVSLAVEDLQVGPGVEARCRGRRRRRCARRSCRRAQLLDLDVALAADGDALLRRMALHLGRRAHDAQHLGRERERLGAFEGDASAAACRR